MTCRRVTARSDTVTSRLSGLRFDRLSRRSIYWLSLPPTTTCSAASTFENLVESVQLVTKLAELGLFYPQSLLSFNFLRLTLLFFAFQRFESCLEFGNRAFH